MAGALLAETPALPLHEAGKYVAGAYIVLFALVLIYVAIMAVRLSRVERGLSELLEHEQGPGAARDDAARELSPEELRSHDASPESTPV